MACLLALESLAQFEAMPTARWELSRLSLRGATRHGTVCDPGQISLPIWLGVRTSPLSHRLVRPVELSDLSVRCIITVYLYSDILTSCRSEKNTDIPDPTDPLSVANAIRDETAVCAAQFVPLKPPNPGTQVLSAGMGKDVIRRVGCGSFHTPFRSYE